jgi:peroxiredoxin
VLSISQTGGRTRIRPPLLFLTDSPGGGARYAMAIQVGDRLPDGTLTELIEVETPGCTLGPNTFKVSDHAHGKRVVILGVPGAFTPTCSGKHLPGYVASYEQLKSRRVDEIWCIAVNDAFVMSAWGKEQKCRGKVRMLADGNATYTRPLGLDQDLTARGMGTRSLRYSIGYQPGCNEDEGGENHLDRCKDGVGVRSRRGGKQGPVPGIEAAGSRQFCAFLI